MQKERPTEELRGRRYRKAGMEAEAGLQTEKAESASFKDGCRKADKGRLPVSAGL